MAMKSVAGFIAGVALLLLPGLSLAASIPGAGSCGLRNHAEEWMKAADAKSPGYSVVDVVDPRTGQVMGQIEVSFWSNDLGETAVVSFRIIDDPQRGKVPFGCIILRGDGNQAKPIFLPGRGA